MEDRRGDKPVLRLGIEIGVKSVSSIRISQRDQLHKNRYKAELIQEIPDRHPEFTLALRSISQPASSRFSLGASASGRPRTEQNSAELPALWVPYFGRAMW